MSRAWTVGALLAVLACGAGAARVLAVLPTNTRSHYAMYGRLLDALATRNHDITVISHFNMSRSRPNVEEISLAGTVREIANNLTRARGRLPHLVTNLGQIMDECVEACESLAKVDAVKALLNSTVSFDLVLVEVFGTECPLGFAHRFGAPVVGLLSSVPLPWINSQIANPENPAYIPSYMVGYGQSMRLWERFANTLAILYAKFAYRLRSQIPSQIIAEKLFGSIPPLEQLARNYSLILANSHFSINEVRPLVPTLVEVGGLHLDNTQQLPKNLQKLLDSSTEGVIYWSFGSISRIETIPLAVLRSIFNVFSEMPHRVIVKMNLSALPANLTVPENVHAQKWMPQYKTLCHPNVRLFISHGGLLGTQEAVACGVPMLVVPLYADQALNARAISDRGAALAVDFASITEELWRDNIRELLGNPMYKANAMRLSSIFLDRPTSALETGIYWIEYVLRHSGAPHLKSPALDLPLYQYLLLDVVAISILFILLLLTMILYLVRSIHAILVSWWPTDKLVFEKNLFKRCIRNTSVLRNIVCKVKTN